MTLHSGADPDLVFGPREGDPAFGYRCHYCGKSKEPREAPLMSEREARTFLAFHLCPARQTVVMKLEQAGLQVPDDDEMHHLIREEEDGIQPE